MKPARINVIDAFRGVSVIAVMAFHYLNEWRAELNLGISAPEWISAGKYGVSVFFVISGFAITLTLMESKNALEFLIKRFARIYPAFLFASAMVFAILSVYDPLNLRIPADTLPAALTAFPREIARTDFVDSAYWSIGVELKFYAYTALAYYFFRDRFWIALVWLAVVGAAATLLADSPARVILLAPFVPLFLIGIALHLYFMTEAKFEALFCAIIGWTLYTFHSAFFERDASPAWSGHAFIVASVACMTILLALAPQTKLGPLAWIGRQSYSLYLLHQFLGITAIAVLANILPPIVAILVVSVTLILLSRWMREAIEDRGRRQFLEFFRRLRLTIARP